MSIYADMQRAGVPIEHHESDLYVPVTTETRAIVHAYAFRTNVHVFCSSDGTLWYDIPFAFNPYWENKNRS